MYGDSFLFHAWVSKIYLRNKPKPDELSGIIHFFPVKMLRRPISLASSNITQWMFPLKEFFEMVCFFLENLSQKAGEETIYVVR